MGMRAGGAAAVGILLISACATPPEPAAPVPEPAPSAESAPAPAPAVEPPPPSATITNPPDVDAAVAEFRAFLKTEPAPQDLRRRVEDLAAHRDPRVVDALAGVVRNPRISDASREAAARLLVEQGDPHVLGTLQQLADTKHLAEEHPSVLVALLEEMGECDPKQTHEWLLKMGKKHMSRDAGIAGAAFRGASRHATREVVDELIRAMEYAKHAAADQGDQATTTPAEIESRLGAILEEMTGVYHVDTDAWRRWWSENQKTWTPPVSAGEGEPEVGVFGKFTDAVYGVSVDLPRRNWRLRKPSEWGHFVLAVEVPDGDQRAAWCELYIYETRLFAQKTPPQIAETWRLNNVLKFRELNVAEWDGKATVSGCAGVEQRLIGLHKELGRVELRNRFVERDGVMYYWVCGRRLGADPSHGAGVALVLDSFELPR